MNDDNLFLEEEFKEEYEEEFEKPSVTRKNKREKMNTKELLLLLLKRQDSIIKDIRILKSQGANNDK